MDEKTLNALLERAWYEVDKLITQHGKDREVGNAVRDSSTAASLLQEWVSEKGLSPDKKLTLRDKLAPFVTGKLQNLRISSGFLGLSKAPCVSIREVYYRLMEDPEVIKAAQDAPERALAARRALEAQFGIKDGR